MDPIRLMIVDDHRIFTDALSFALESEDWLQVVATATNPDDAFKVLNTSTPPIQIVLMDIRMGEDQLDGLEATSHIHQQFPGTRVIILSMHSHGKYVQKAMENKASGYLLKESHADEVLKAIKQVAEGGSYYSEEVRKSEADYRFESFLKGPDKKLTKREKEVLQLIVDGLSTAEIADKLCIGEAGVETHRRNLRNKLNVKNTAALVREGIRMGLVDLT